MPALLCIQHVCTVIYSNLSYIYSLLLQYVCMALQHLPPSPSDFSTENKTVGLGWLGGFSPPPLLCTVKIIFKIQLLFN